MIHRHHNSIMDRLWALLGCFVAATFLALGLFMALICPVDHRHAQSEAPTKPVPRDNYTITPAGFRPFRVVMVAMGVNGVCNYTKADGAGGFVAGSYVVEDILPSVEQPKQGTP